MVKGWWQKIRIFTDREKAVIIESRPVQLHSGREDDIVKLFANEILFSISESLKQKSLENSGLQSWLKLKN